MPVISSLHFMCGRHGSVDPITDPTPAKPVDKKGHCSASWKHSIAGGGVPPREPGRGSGPRVIVLKVSEIARTHTDTFTHISESSRCRILRSLPHLKPTIRTHTETHEHTHRSVIHTETVRLSRPLRILPEASGLTMTGKLPPRIRPAMGRARA